MKCEICGCEIDEKLEFCDGRMVELREKCARFEMDAMAEDADREMGLYD